MCLPKSKTGAGVIGRLGGRDTSMVWPPLACLCSEFCWSIALSRCMRSLFTYIWISTQRHVHLCTWHAQTHRPGASFMRPTLHKLRSCINRCNPSCPWPIILQIPDSNAIVAFLWWYGLPASSMAFLMFPRVVPCVVIGWFCTLCDSSCSTCSPVGTWLTVYHQMQMLLPKSNDS